MSVRLGVAPDCPVYTTGWDRCLGTSGKLEFHSCSLLFHLGEPGRPGDSGKDGMSGEKGERGEELRSVLPSPKVEPSTI